jgi:hypothetical protein
MCNKKYQTDIKRIGQVTLIGWYLLILTIVLSVAVMFGGCKSIQYVPVETIRTEIIHKTDTFIQKDSCVVKDSVFIHAKRDVVFEKYSLKSLAISNIFCNFGAWIGGSCNPSDKGKLTAFPQS